MSFMWTSFFGLERDGEEWWPGDGLYARLGAKRCSVTRSAWLLDAKRCVVVVWYVDLRLRISHIYYPRLPPLRIMTVLLCLSILPHKSITVPTSLDRSLALKRDTLNGPLTVYLQPRNEHAQQTGDNKVTDRRPDVQPTALVLDHEKERQRHNVADRHDHHEQRAWRNAKPAVEKPEVGGQCGKGNHQLQHEQRALAEGVEDRDEAVYGVKGEGRHGGDVRGAEEGGLDEEEEK